jgi:hypothetical protein
MAADDLFTSDLRDWARSALRQSGISTNAAMFDALMTGIAESIANYQIETARLATFRKAHNALRALFALLEDKDPSPAIIRKKSSALPAPATAWVERRAKVLWPRLIGCEFSRDAFEAWLALASRDDLVRILRVLVSEGGAIVEGRSDDRKPQLRFEPLIMGTVRGSGDSTLRGGRPSAEARDDLVMNLALDWHRATQQMPALKRGDTHGFPSLVHRVFDLCEIEGAEQALRRYADERRRDSQSSDGGQIQS